MTLREQIDRFLEDTVLAKSPEDRTARENQLLEYGRAFSDVLFRQERGDNSKLERHEETMLRLSKQYNEINREYDLRDVDAETLANLRKGRR